jgi:hypothetical protein
MTKSRDRLPDGLSPLKHSFQVRLWLPKTSDSCVSMV